LARITATNVKGASSASTDGNGAAIISAPDAPVSLQEDLTQRTVSTLGLQWQVGDSDGGSAIIDFTATIKLQDGTLVQSIVT
jgi:hypothetical protein